VTHDKNLGTPGREPHAQLARAGERPQAMEDRWAKTPDIPPCRKVEVRMPTYYQCNTGLMIGITSYELRSQKVITVTPSQVCRARLMTSCHCYVTRVLPTDIKMFSCQYPHRNEALLVGKFSYPLRLRQRPAVQFRMFFIHFSQVDSPSSCSCCWVSIDSESIHATISRAYGLDCR